MNRTNYSRRACGVNYYSMSIAEQVNFLPLCAYNATWQFSQALTQYKKMQLYKLLIDGKKLNKFISLFLER